MERFWKALNSGAGLLLLGFLVTTSGGAFINHVIQRSALTYKQRFEMYKIWLPEAKVLQTELLKHSNERRFYLEQVVTRAGNEEASSKETRKYWRDNYSSVKDNWNTKLITFHSKLGVLFDDDLADLLLCCGEGRLIIKDPVLEKLAPDSYEKTKPKSLHGAFVDIHATAYHIVFKCLEENDRPECVKNERPKLINLVEKQMAHLDQLHICLSYAITGKLLVDPYGPRPSYSLPEKCASYAPTR